MLIQLLKPSVVPGNANVLLLGPVSEINTCKRPQILVLATTNKIDGSRSVVNIGQYQGVVAFSGSLLNQLVDGKRTKFITVVCMAIQ